MNSFITGHKMIKNSNSSEVPKLDVLFIFHEMGKLIRAQIVKQRQPAEAIHNAAQKLKEKVEFEIHLAPDGLKHTPTYISTLKIHDILISEAKASSKKNARSEAAKYGVEKLMKSSLEVVLIDNVLTLKETALQKKEKLPQENKKVQPKPCLQSSSRNQQAKQFTKPNATVSGSSKSQQILQDFKFNGATFPQHFLLLDNSDARRMEGPIALLTNSASFCHVPLQFEFENLPHVPGHHLSIRCDIVCGKRVLSSAANISKQAAKIDAVEAALVKLRKLVYTVKVKDEHSDGFFISRNQVLDITGSENSVSENNIGCKMLKMMGWSGGGIGKQGNVGIAEPVAAEDAHEHGKGLGYSSDRAVSKRFTSRIESLIQDYAKSNTTSDLIFATEFSKEERKEIHRIATKYGLKNNSVGKEENRHIIVRRRFTAQELLAHLLEVGGSTNKYELIPPESGS